MELEVYRRYSQMARGLEKAELVFKNGRVFSSGTGEFIEGDVAVADGIVIGVGTYEGYWASATFTPDDGYVFGNIMMWNFDETLIKTGEDIISNAFENGKYTFYFTSKIGSDKCKLIRTDKNGKNEKVIAKLKYRDEYTINSYHGGNLYFSDSDAFYKCNIEKKVFSIQFNE